MGMFWKITDWLSFLIIEKCSNHSLGLFPKNHFPHDIDHGKHRHLNDELPCSYSNYDILPNSDNNLSTIHTTQRCICRPTWNWIRYTCSTLKLRA